jgi:hypothetical protein
MPRHGDALSIWVIYDHPRDFPDRFIARRHVVTGSAQGPTEDIVADKSLKQLRRVMESRFLTKLDRHPSDDPTIIETWL